LSPLKEIAEETPATVPSHPTRFTKKIRRNTKISPKPKITAGQQKPQQQRILKPFLPIRNQKKKGYDTTTRNHSKIHTYNRKFQCKERIHTRQDETD
jgi:hypothetical protein